MMEFKAIERQSIIVWLYTLKQVKNIRKFGHIQFISKKLRYVVLYTNRNEINDIKEKLEKLHYVQKVEVSHLDDIDKTWKNAIPNRKDKDVSNKNIKVPTEETTTEYVEDLNNDPFIKTLRDSLLNKEVE